MKNKHLKLKMNLKMTSNVGIIVFTLIGIAIYLLTFLGVAFTAPKLMAFWKIVVYGVGGALFVGMFIVAVLRFFRYFLMKQTNKKRE